LSQTIRAITRVWVAAAEVGEIIRAVGCTGSVPSPTALRVGIVGIELAAPTVGGAARSIEIIGNAANVGRNGWSGAEATVRADAFAAALFIDNDNHPDTHGTGVTQEWCAVNPTRTALALAVLVRTCKPANLCSDTTAFSKRCC